MKNALYEYIDDNLYIRAENIVDTVKESVKKCGYDKSGEFICNDKIKAEIENAINSHIKNPALSSISVRLLNSKGEVILNSFNTPDFLNTAEINISKLVSGNSYYETFHLRYNRKIFNYRSYLSPVKIRNRVIYIVQTLRPAEQSNFTIKSIQKYIMIFIPVMVLITAFLGMMVVKITLKPLDNISSAMNEIINENNLKLKVSLPNNKDEIWKLADMFNKMIENLEKSPVNSKINLTEGDIVLSKII